MLKRNQTLEDGRISAKEAKNGGSKDKRRITRKECQRLVSKFEMEGFMAHKMFVKSCALPKEEGDAEREYEAMHEAIFFSSWLR